MLCSRINSYSNYRFKKEVALVLIAELKAIAKVNNHNKNKKFQPNQAVENLNIKLLHLLLTQARC